MSVVLKPFRKATPQETERFEHLMKWDRGFQAVVFPACPETIPNMRKKMCAGFYGDYPIAFREVVSDTFEGTGFKESQWKGELAVYLSRNPFFPYEEKSGAGAGQLLTIQFEEGSSTYALSSLAYVDVTHDGITDLVFLDGLGNLYIAETERIGPIQEEGIDGGFENVVGDIIKGLRREI